MFLSSLEMFGFKSFGRRTTIHFSEGVSAIVGPNGTGKTNILDAIRWVIGEKSYKLMRSGGLSDIIFKGTPSHKALSVAEVTLTFERCKGLLPYDPTADKVAITRRAFRDGESEFLINGQIVRLKDIRSILMDTGVGSAVYAIIELSMIRQILEDNSESRRALFEEAAGITKYKADRRETYNRLASTEQDLERIKDILAEVQSVVNRLRAQASRAKRYARLRSKLADAQRLLIVREHSTALKKMTALETEIKGMQDEKGKQSVLVGSIRQKVSELAVRKEDITQGREKALELLWAAEREISENEQQIALLKQRQETIADRELPDVHSRLQDFEKQLVNLDSEISTTASQIEKTEAELTTLLNEIKSLATDYDALLQSLISLRGERESLITEQNKLEEKARAERLSIQRLMDKLKLDKSRIDELSEQKIAIEGKLSDGTETIKEMRERKDKLKQTLQEKEAKFVEVEEKLSEQRRIISSLDGELSNIRRNIGNIEAEIAGIEGALNRISASDEGSSYLIEHKDEFHIAGQLSDFIIPESTEQALTIERLLGEKAHFLLCEKLSDAKGAIEELRKQKIGSAGIFVVELIRKKHKNDHAPVIDGIEFRFPELAFLLNGFSIADETIIAPFFVIGGSDGEDAKGPFTLKTRQRELAIQLKKSREEEVSLANKLAKLKKNEGKLTIQRDAAVKNRGSIELEINRVEQEIDIQEKELKRLENIALTLAKQIESIRQKNEELDARKHTAGSNLQDIDEKLKPLSSKISSLSQALAQKDEKLRLIEKEQNALEVKRTRLESELNHLKLTAERLSASTALRHTTIESEEERQKKLEDELNKIADKQNSLAQKMEKLSLKRDEKEKTINSLSEEESELTAAIRNEQKKLAVEEEKFAELADKLLRNEIDYAAAKASHESLKQEHPEIAFISDETKRKAEALSDDEFNQLRSEVEIKRRKVEQFGAVNLEAQDEYDREKERLDFLKKQQKDLLDSIASMRVSIRTLNSRARKAFNKTFEVVRKNFQAIFSELFDGGEADIHLDENVDVLESPIGISVHPRGKKKLSVEQLSQGEKALTALSLLFAMYLVKPSPFCLLDEVDSPLDEANINRFLKLVRRLGNDTQFILITHNNRTMQTVDNLYGVTMEDAISRIYTIRMGDLKLEL